MRLLLLLLIQQRCKSNPLPPPPPHPLIPFQFLSFFLHRHLARHTLGLAGITIRFLCFLLDKEYAGLGDGVERMKETEKD